jgi:putative heme-binding domain-containing protein
MRFGPDGHMYFLTGGRNTDSKLYRIRYVGDSKGGEVRQLTENQKLRDLRRSIEKYHHQGVDAETAINEAWQYLGHDDRNIRYAARLAIENQDVSLWKDRALKEKDPKKLIYSMIALSRHSGEEQGSAIIDRLDTLSFDKLQTSDQLALLRAYSLCFIRNGKPSSESITKVTEQLDPHYPSTEENVNIELCRVLSYLNAPNVVSKTIKLMKSTQTKTLAYDKEMLGRSEYGKEILATMSDTPNSLNIHYAYCLRRVKNGWSLDDRKYYFGWLNETLEKGGGKSFAGYIRAIRQDAIDHLPEDKKASVSYLLGDIATIDLSKLPTPKGPGNAWTVETAMKHFEQPLTGRDFENGKKMFSAGRCIACHRFSGDGGYSGPDLGSLGNRFSVQDMLVAIIEPNQSISEQYQASTVTLNDGGQLYGRLIYKNDKELAVASNPFDLSQVIKKPVSEVVKIEPSQRSLMYPGMINMMNQEELKDLIAYLKSGGNKKDKVFLKEK